MFYLPGVFVEHSVLGTQEEEEEEKVPEMIPPKKNPRELLKQLSRISVVDGTNIMTFRDPPSSKGNVKNASGKLKIQNFRNSFWLFSIDFVWERGFSLKAKPFERRLTRGPNLDYLN